MRPHFETLWMAYPRTQGRAALYRSLGWNDLVDRPAYLDTCAIRMSYGLLCAGGTLPGATMEVRAGPLKGKWIEPRQAGLSRILTRVWGQPEIFGAGQPAEEGIGARRGVASFFRIEGGHGGHIDLIVPNEHGYLACARSCYFSALKVWFWPL